MKKVNTLISKSLHDEILESQKTLNSIEFQKCIGKKKKSWSFVEASDKVGKHLSSLRRQRSKSKSLEDLF